MTRLGSVMLVLTLIVIDAATAHADLLSNAFTYQGRLDDAGTPATGTYDFEFRLMYAETGFGQVGQPCTIDNVWVQDGLFAVTLNSGNEFGTSAFDGSARWLLIGVRPGNQTGSFTALSPRQPVTAAPYALTAGSLAVPSYASGDTDAIFVPTGLLSVWQGGSAAAILGLAPYGGIAVHGVASGDKPAILAQNSGTGAAVAARNTGDGPALTIESGALRVAGAGIGTATCAFVLEVSDENRICDSFGCFYVEIDHPFTDGDPNAILIVTPRTGVNYWPVASGVMYDSDTQKWWLFPLVFEPYSVGMRYNVLVIKS